MADRYIDLAYVQACLEPTIAAALAADADELNILIEDASAEVAAMMRNSGYSMGASPFVVADVHPTVRSATMCGVWERLAMRPRFSLSLPDNWADMPYRRALDGIESGELVLGANQSLEMSPGAWIFSDFVSRTGGGKLSGY